MGSLLNPDAELLSLAQFRKCLPGKAKMNVDQSMIDKVNSVIQNSPERESFRDNLLSYTSVLNEGKYSVQAYINAVRYVGLKLAGDGNFVAYVKVFPERHSEWLKKGWAEKDMMSAVSTYHRTQLVTKILEQSLIPNWILNQDLYQKALNVSAELMMNARSEKVRADAANNLMNQLKQPENQKIELEVGMKEDDSIAELRRSTMELVKQQRMMLEAGAMKATEIAQQKVIVGGEVVSEQG